MASRDLVRRLEALEAERNRTGRYEPLREGQHAAFEALRGYGPGRLTWERFNADLPQISEEDKRDPYEAMWSFHTKHPHLETLQATLDCPPWAVSQLAGKVIND